MGYFFTEFFNDLVSEIKDTRPSLRFWYLIGVFILAGVGYLHLLSLLITLVILTCIGVVCIFEEGPWDCEGYLLWIFYTPLGWLMLIIATLVWLFQNTILKFNNWLDQGYRNY